MTDVWTISGWFLAALFGLLTVSMLLLKNWLPAIVLCLVVLLCLPPADSFVRDQLGWSIPPLLRLALIVGLLFIFVRLLVGAKVTSIYKSPEVKARFMEIYDEKMRGWPTPYADVFVNTSYGKVHVIASGSEDAPPLLLLHASGVAGWSWKFNVEELSKRYRTYAIDLIGDAGKSEFTSLDHILKSGQDQAELHVEITQQLNAEQAYVVGASEGGFIGTNYALYHPERVKKLVLLGSMGYAGATQSIIRIMFAQFFPLRPIQERTFRWAFSDSPVLEEEFGEWFRLFMTGYNPVKVSPLPFSAEERQSLKVPVLFVFGEKDNLVGDPAAARALVQDVPDARVTTLKAGHLMSAEQPEQVNTLITSFCAEE